VASAHHAPDHLVSCGAGELFPTLLRSTAQGLMFAVVRIALGFWSLYVPTLTKSGFSTLAWILTGFVAVSGLIGFVFAPRNEGKTLDQIQRERQLQVVSLGACGAALP
jgi:MFS transporter, SP family, inositol transporter